ncbi:MAG: transcriptional repressor LexA [Patescibacteria group bacterium]
MATLTKKQKGILDFIASYTEKHGVSPTIEEIGRHFKRAIGTIHEHVEELVKKGLIKKNNYIRGIEIQNTSDLVEIPLKGYIAAGSPIEVFEQYETITVPRANLSGAGEHFALRVRGNSMIEEGIFNGDTVVIRKQNTASNGETVVAIINGNEATLKKIYRFQTGFRLQPANPEMKPIFVKNLLVQGKVVSVIRNFENNTNIEQISSNEEYIVSKEYSEKSVNLDQLINELVNFRDIVIFKYGFHTKDDFFKTQIIDGLILQEIFRHIANTKKINTNTQTINEILKELNLNDIKFTKDDVRILEDILKKYNFSACDDDMLGFIYQSIRPQSGRKEDGQYYTPKKVVKYILDNIKINLAENKDLKILDPACGSGQFLLEAYDILYNQYKEIGEKNETEIHANIIKDHLIGFDIDKIAINLTKLNLFLKSSGTYIGKFNILTADTLKRDSNLLESNQLDKYKNSIDYLVGNPPWGANLDEKQKKYYKNHYEIGKNGLNTFTLFIERAFDFLKENGKLGYLIPEAYLKIKVHQLSRLQILDRAKIQLLGISGDIFQKVYAPCLVMIFQQEKDKATREKNEISIENGVFNGQTEHKMIIQKNFEKSADNIFNINQVGETEEILNHILAQKNCYLKDNALFILGIVTGNNKKYLIQEKKDDRYSPIIVGKDISKYKINFTGNYFIYDKNILQQIAPKEYYTVPEKIIYKFIGEKLSFAYDDKQYFTLNNANAFVPKIEKLKTKYILALLNSKLMQFFYSKSFFTVRVLRGNLEKLPLVNAEQEKQDEIIGLVNHAINSKNDETFKVALNKIDDEIFSLYKMPEKWRQYIYKEV